MKIYLMLTVGIILLSVEITIEIVFIVFFDSAAVFFVRVNASSDCVTFSIFLV